MRIAHLPSSYLPDSLGGTEVYVQTLCEELERAGHETAVVWHSSTVQGLPENAITLSARRLARRSHLYTTFEGNDPPGFGAFLHNWNPDVVHFHAFTLGSGADHADCCRREGIPYVVTYHTPQMSCPRGTLLHWGKESCDGRMEPGHCAACALHGRGWPKAVALLAGGSRLPHGWFPTNPLLPRFALRSILRETKERWSAVFAGAKTIVACAEFCRDAVIANGVPSERIVLQRQGIPGDDRLATLRLPLRQPVDGPLRIGYFGRIAPLKGPQDLPLIVNWLQAAGIPAEGQWVGPVAGGEQRWAEAMFTAAEPQVRYLGVKLGDDLAAWIRSCDLIVIPSRWLETGPLTLLEAWDQGTPVIGASRGGIREFMIANDLQECLFDVDDTASVVAAVGRMISWAGAPPVVRVPGMRSLAKRMVEIYQRACERSDSVFAESMA